MKLTQKLISMLLVLVMLVGLVPAVFAEQAQVSTVQTVTEAGGAKQAKSASAVPAAPAAQPEGELAPDENGEINGETKFVFDFSGVMPDKVVTVPWFSFFPQPPAEPLIEAWYYNKDLTGKTVDFRSQLGHSLSEFRIYAKWKMQYVLHYPDHIERQNWRLQRPKDDPNILAWYMEPDFKTPVNWNTIYTIREPEIHIYAKKAQTQDVRFIDYDEDGNRKPQPGEKRASPISVQPKPLVLDGGNLTNGWYVLSEDYTTNDRVRVYGHVSLILADGCTLEARNGIGVPEGSSLTIYAQSDGSRMGTIRATGSKESAGIGADDEHNGGAITINGGRIMASGHNLASGIGGSRNGGCGEITINGGFVRVSGGDPAPAIGGRGAGIHIRNNPLIRAGNSDAMHEVFGVDYVRELNCRQVLISDRRYVTVYEVKGEADLTIPIPTEHVEQGGKLDIPLYETETGYITGWYKDKELTQRWDPERDTVTQDMTLFAKCVEKYLVQFDACGIGTPPESVRVKDGARLREVRLPDTEDEHFAGWYTNPQYFRRAWDFGRDTVRSDMTLYAKWEKKCVVTFDANGHGVAPDPVKVAYGERMKEIKPADTEDAHFLGWYRDKSGRGAAWDFGRDTVRSDMTLYARWEEKCVVTFDANGHGTAPAPIKVSYGGKLPRTKAEDTEDMHFVGWYRDKSGRGAAWDFGNDVVRRDMTLYAKWEDKLTVTFDANGHGVAPAPAKVVHGERMPEVKAADTEDMHFIAWYRNKACTGRPWDFRRDTVTQDMKLYAGWEEKCTVTFDNRGCGVTPAPVKVVRGERMQEIKPADTEDMHFVSWHRDKDCTGRAWDFGTDTVHGNITLYAKWTEIYTVTFDNRGFGVTPAPVKVVRGERMQEIKPADTEEMHFTGWYPNRIYSGRAWDFKIDTVKKNMTLYAKWEKKSTPPAPHYSPAASAVSSVPAPEFKLVLTIGQKLADLNGKSVENDVAPVIRENRTMLPIAFIIDALGGKIEWNAEDRTVTITLGDTKLMLTIGSKVMLENDKEVSMDVAPFISENRTYLPLSFVADALDAEAVWDEIARTVTVTK